MFLRNKTPFEVSLAHGQIDDEHAVAAVITETAYRIDGVRLERLDKLPDRTSTDPPDTSCYVLWEGVSVTATGSAAGPDKAPFVRPVVFRIGNETRRLIVFGDRQWESTFDGQLLATSPARFEAIPLSFTMAYGGSIRVPPGLSPVDNLPHPGFTAEYQLNGTGRGYYLEEAQARGNPLPNIERPNQLIKSWRDQPEPAGFSPCRDLVMLRLYAMPELARARDLLGEHPPVVAAAKRIAHHAPAPLIFPELAPGTAISLEGLEKHAPKFHVPAAPTNVTTRRRKTNITADPMLRAIHVDCDTGIVRFVHAHELHYSPAYPPHWIRVEANRVSAAQEVSVV